MNFLVTNDDGYAAQGIQALVRAVRQFGSVTVIAPKYHQSGMAMAVSMGFKPIAVKELGEIDGVRWIYLDGTPASCVKFGVDEVFTEGKPDLVISGINHGSNAATAACYSGTLGAAMEAAVNGIPAIGVSLDCMNTVADFSAVEALFPSILERIMELHDGKFGSFYNVNFPNIPADSIKGIRVGHMGIGHWEREFMDWDPSFFSKFGIDHTKYGLATPDVECEEGERLYMMVGDFTDDPMNDDRSDHRLLEAGYISVVKHNFDNTDIKGSEALKSGLETDFTA